MFGRLTSWRSRNWMGPRQRGWSRKSDRVAILFQNDHRMSMLLVRHLQADPDVTQFRLCHRLRIHSESR